MAITFDTAQLRELGLTSSLSVLDKLTAHLAAQGVSGEVIPYLFCGLPLAYVAAQSQMGRGADFPKEGISVLQIRDTLLVFSQLTSGGEDQQCCPYMGRDDKGNMWYAFPAVHDQFGMTCISLVRLNWRQG